MNLFKKICSAATALLLCGAAVMTPSLTRVSVYAADAETYPEIKAGYVYSIMNCDTGREISRDGVSEFLFEYTGKENTFCLRDPETGRYLKKSGSVVSFTDEKTKAEFTFIRKKYNRYFMCIGDSALSDNGGGESAYPALAMQNKDTATSISYCWYITAQGTQKPLRIMPLGDSLTYGNNVDVPTAEHGGYRAFLSELLAKNNPNLRFAFVGSESSGGKSTVDTLALYRHEGHNAHTVYYLDYGDPYLGIFQRCDPWLAKYQPDVIILMLGTNDLGLNKTKGEKAAIQTADYQRKLVQKLCDQTPLNLLVLASSPPSETDTSFNQIVSLYNELIWENGERFEKDGREVVYPDVYSLIKGIGASAFCSDGGHMSKSGYEAIGELHYETLMKTDYINTALSNISEDIKTLSAREEITEIADIKTDDGENETPPADAEPSENVTPPADAEPSDDGTQGNASGDTEQVKPDPETEGMSPVVIVIIAVAGAAVIAVAAILVIRSKKK